MKHLKRVLTGSNLNAASSLFFRCLLVNLVVALLSLALSAQGGSERLFDEANLLYQQQDFQGARDKYLQIEGQGEVSSALYYNLANSYYKLDNFGKAILYYERALRLDPGDDDIQANLRAANQATVDQIIPPEQFELARWLIWFLYVISPPSLLNLAAVAYLSASSLLVVAILSRSPRVKRICRRGTLAVGILLILSIAIAAAQWWDSRTRLEAVVIESEIEAMSAPDESAVELFLIHEGTKVRVDQATGGWIEIVLLDGKVGWVRSEGVEII